MAREAPLNGCLPLLFSHFYSSNHVTHQCLRTTYGVTGSMPKHQDNQMSHEHDGCCGCAPRDPMQRERQFADAMRREAQGYLNPEQLPLARAMLNASRTVLAARGGVNGEIGVWLLVAEAHLPEIEGNSAQALIEHQAALDLSEKDLGGEHLATGVCLLNVAETLVNLGRPADAKPLYERANEILTKCAEGYKETDEYMCNFASEAASAALVGLEAAAQKTAE